MSTTDWSIRTMDHAMGSDRSLGTVHATGGHCLASPEGVVHDILMISTHTQ